jgi:hypothetical protein
MLFFFLFCAISPLSFRFESLLHIHRMIAATTSEGRGLSEEERTIRREEAELLAKISAPPSRDGLDQVLEQNRAQLLQNQKEKTQKKT